MRAGAGAAGRSWLGDRLPLQMEIGGTANGDWQLEASQRTGEEQHLVEKHCAQQGGQQLGILWFIRESLGYLENRKLELWILSLENYGDEKD